MESPQDVVVPEVEESQVVEEEVVEQVNVLSQAEVMKSVKKMLADALNYKGYYAQRYYSRIEALVDGVSLDEETVSTVKNALQKIDEEVRSVMGTDWKEKYAQQIKR
ncbi:MAG: hypothetical protein P1V18_01690 [Candidatus Gracilibacteria bacterium]|nr:hypothetical protein [Candidatus Gracilibacteria bacterium]